MNSAKVFKPKSIVMLASLIFLVFITTLIYQLGKEDDLALETFQYIDENTEYSLELGESLQHGKLGDFYHCIKNYRPVREIRTKDGKDGRAKLVISDFTFFKFLTIDNEVYRFYIGFVEDGLDSENKKVFRTSRKSKSYAVNCDLSLLSISE
ncbi:hypothetical protein [Ferrimonas aestuarii]|uniref:Uncharacterized protein n=1 Tax=Ferrimonas aestuarii TaxID=2569539 RepID=A0A4U1BL09_9GAMM|nr:hypothetical protein [Ferrimonas aestuarii]TKB53345.1 hypothetical protein FCL42_14870 [Ferrimonas aestuarii]